MNISQADLSSTDTTRLIEDLKWIVNLRKQMGGSMYHNMCEDDACTIANRLLDLGVSREVISPILGR